MNFAAYLLPEAHSCARLIPDATALEQACRSSMSISSYYDRQYIGKCVSTASM